MADLCSGNRPDNILRTSHPQLKMNDEDYTVPIYSWSRNKFSEVRQDKLDYVSCFVEKTHPPPEKLNKIFTKKKKDVVGFPGPTSYETATSWSKKSGPDGQKGK